MGDYDEAEASSKGVIFPECTNSWFLLTDDDDDLTKPEVMEVFSNLMQDQRIPFRLGTRCVLRGSDLYEIGGTHGYPTPSSNLIRHLNIEKQEDGWKTRTVPTNLGHPNTVLSGDFIYMFSSAPWDKRLPPSPWACVYDTKNEWSYILDIPDPHNSLPHLSLFMPVKDGVQIYLGDRSCPDQPLKWFVHNAHTRKWEEKIEESGYTKPFRDIARPFVISNDHLYIFDNTYFIGPVLYVYSIGGGLGSYKYLGMIRLPQLENMKYDFDFSMVPVSDYKISFIWYERGRVGRRKVDENFIVYAKIRVYLDTPAAPTASLLKQAKIPIKAIGINDCIAFSHI